LRRQQILPKTEISNRYRTKCYRLPQRIEDKHFNQNVAKRAFWKKTMEALAQLKVYMTGLEITDTAIASVEARYDRIQKLVDAQDE